MGSLRGSFSVLLVFGHLLRGGMYTFEIRRLWFLALFLKMRLRFFLAPCAKEIYIQRLSRRGPQVCDLF